VQIVVGDLRGRDVAAFPQAHLDQTHELSPPEHVHARGTRMRCAHRRPRSARARPRPAGRLRGAGGPRWSSRSTSTRWISRWISHRRPGPSPPPIPDERPFRSSIAHERAVRGFPGPGEVLVTGLLTRRGPIRGGPPGGPVVDQRGYPQHPL